MADSWEDQVDEQPPPPPPPARPAGFAFNPNASTFSFNPNASSFSFVPGGQPPPPPPPARPQPPPPPAPVAQPPPPAAQPPPPPRAPEPPAPPAPEPEPEPEPVAEAAPEPADVVIEEVAEKVEKVQIVEDAPLDQSKVMEAYDRLKADDPREHLNIVFIGHVDAGKSTLSGQILFITGCVDKRTIEKYEREAKEKNREGWYMAYIMDTNEEERTKGITVEVGRAHFETQKKRYTILDAPGHKNYVPNMIQGASQADVAVLVISSRKGEFEAGAERGGQTIEHAQLAKTLGVTRLIVVVNKLDDHSVALPGGQWDKARYDYIVNQLTPAFKACQYNIKRDITFLPIAALYGKNIRDKVPKEECPWYDGPTLFEVLDAIPAPDRNPEASFRMPIMDKYKDMGTIVMGRSEAGLVQVGDVLQIMPNRLRVKVESLYRDEKEVSAALAGENLRLRLTGADETDVSTGFVLSSIKSPVPCVTQFEAQILVLDLPETKSIFTVGYKCVLHLHCITEECEVTKLVAEIDKKTGAQKKSKFVKSQGACICRIQVDKAICLESFSDLPAMGRFTLRDEGKTIAIGKVTKLPKSAAGS